MKIPNTIRRKYNSRYSGPKASPSRSTKHILGAEGAPSWDILEVLHPVSEEDFNALLEGISP